MNIKCRICGGNVVPSSTESIGTCAGCGFVTTYSSDSHFISPLNRGHFFRRAEDFDRASAAFSEILEHDPDNSEALFGRALSRFGVIYSVQGNSVSAACRLLDGCDFSSDPDYLTALKHCQDPVAERYKLECAVISASSAERVPDISITDVYIKLRESDWKSASDYVKVLLRKSPSDGKLWFAALLVERKCRRPEELKDCTAPLEESQYYRNAVQYADPVLQNTLKQCNQHIINRLADLSEQKYHAALQLLDRASTPKHYKILYGLFTELGEYEDSESLANYCLKRAKSPTAAESSRSSTHRRKKRNTARILMFAAAIILLSVVGWQINIKLLIPQKQYFQAESILQQGDWVQAISLFEDLNGFKDSRERAQKLKNDKYQEAEQNLLLGHSVLAASTFGALGDFRDSKARSLELWDGIIGRNIIAAGGWFSASINRDEGVTAVGDNRSGQCNTGTLQKIHSISAGWSHLVALTQDRTVLCVGSSSDGLSEVGTWSDVVQVSAGQWHTVALLSNGRVVGTGCEKDNRLDIKGWEGVSSVSAGRNHTAALLEDGTVVAVGRNTEGQCNTQNWYSITAISAGGEHTLGLRSDGSVLAVGSPMDGACYVDDWTDITAVSAGYYHSVGLRSDGTVVAVGSNLWGQCNVSDWTNIVAISAGGWHTLGLRADGTIVSTGRNVLNQCDTALWQCLVPQT